MSGDPIAGALSCSHGYVVVADNGPLGVVETPLFPPGRDEPDYLVVRQASGARHPVVPVSLVESAEPGLVRLAASVEEIDRLPEDLPLALERQAPDAAG
jgi:hypothetical protein